MGRVMARTVLVDDTPLAFLHQPNNGVPVLGFRGDPDDRLLGEAVLPLLQVRHIEGAREAMTRMRTKRRPLVCMHDKHVAQSSCSGPTSLPFGSVCTALRSGSARRIEQLNQFNRDVCCINTLFGGVCEGWLIDND